MRYSSLVNRIAGERSEAWSIHYAAVDAKRRGEDVIILSVGDPDLATPAVIADAGIAATEGWRHPLCRCLPACWCCARRSPKTPPAIPACRLHPAPT